MEIEKSSKFIKSLYDEEDIDFDTLDYKFEIKMLFDTFASGKNLSITFDNVVDFLDRFNKIHKDGVFSSFSPPLVQEYFCKQLNFLLIIDFILTFFKVDNKDFNVKKLNTKIIFDFFVKLGDFYNFMNYLDVDESFVNYLKYMLILYSFQLDRDVIEDKFFYFISILDEFLQNVIMPQLFREINYNGFNQTSENDESYKRNFPNEIKDYNANLCYCGEAYSFLDDMFIMSNDWYSNPRVTIKFKTVEVLNPEPPPPMNNAYVEHNEDSEYDSDSSDYYSGREIWTPTITKSFSAIEPTDPNFNEYRKLFVLRHYQRIKEKLDSIANEIKNMCGTLKLKKYDDFEPDNKSVDIIKVKTILGCVLNYKKLPGNVYNEIFRLACEYGHIEIVKKLVIQLEGNIGCDNFEIAQTSPNRDIPRYLEECKLKFKKLEDLFAKYEDVNYYEPKIRFLA